MTFSGEAAIGGQSLARNRRSKLSLRARCLCAELFSHGRTHDPTSNPPPSPNGLGGNRDAVAAEETAPLSWRTRLFFGVGGVPNYLGNILVRNLTIPVYQMMLQLDPALVGLALAIPRVWDALIDPFVGQTSDRARTRFGRRRPFIVAGAIGSALSFALIWWVPPDWSPPLQLAWLLCASLFFYTCQTIWAIPFMSLGCELAASYHDRTRLMAAHGYFLKLAQFGSHWIFPLSQLALFGSALGGMRFVTLAVAVVVFGLLGVAPGLFLKERFGSGPLPAPPSVARPRLLAAMAQVFRDRAFATLAALTVLKVVAGMFATSLDYYLLVYYVCEGDLFNGSILKAVLASASAVVGFLSIRPIVRLSEHVGKQRALILIYTLFVLDGLVKWLVFRPGHTWSLLLDALVTAPIWTAMAILMPSMLADICDVDEWRTGERREGLHSSVLMWVQQTAVALALFFSGVVLNVVGFEVARGAAQAPGVILHVRLVLSGAMVFSGLLAMAVLARYPLTHAGVRATGAALAARRAGGSQER